MGYSDHLKGCWHEKILPLCYLSNKESSWQVSFTAQSEPIKWPHPGNRASPSNKTTHTQWIVPCSYLEVHGFHLVFDSMGLSHQSQHWGHLLWVMEILHHSIDGVHHPAGMVPKLAASLHLLWILHVLELAEILFGRWKVNEEPKEANTFQIALDCRRKKEREKSPS